MPASLFVSYAHRDLEAFNWLDRLKLYLAPLRRSSGLEVWDDTRIAPAAQWQQEIQNALDVTTAAILLVGPAFLDSDFILRDELPTLLRAAKTRGCRVYPVVVAYCPYGISALSPYQAFNDPQHPLESLPPAEQNRVLNDLSLRVDADLRSSASAVPAPARAPDLRDTLEQLARTLADTRTAFDAQCRRRNDLVAAMRRRLHATERLEYEKFFHRHYPHLNDAERFEFDQIRAITEGPLHDGNQRSLTLIETAPALYAQIPRLLDLRQHLVFWLNKYDRVFAKRPDMCLLYTGVEDGVPFPNGLDDEIAQWLAGHK